MSRKLTEFVWASELNDDRIQIIMNIIRQNILSVTLSHKIVQFLQSSRKILPNQLLKYINQTLEENDKEDSEELDGNMIMIEKLLDVDKICLNYMSDRLIDLEKHQKILTHSTKQNYNQDNFSSLSLKDSQVFSESNYKTLEEAMQKAQNQIRKHIGIQQNMKICFDQLQQQISELNKNITFLKEQNSQIKRQFLTFKGKQKQMDTKLKVFKIKEKEDFSNKLKANLSKFRSKKKKIEKMFTQPQNNITFSDTLYKKQSNSQYQSSKIQNMHKIGGYQKYGNIKNICDSNMIQSHIDVSIHTISKYDNNKQPQSNIKNSESKEIFWNRRLKKKPTTSYMNHSTNVSPRVIKKQLKQNTQDRYQTITNNTKIFHKSKKFSNQFMYNQKRKAYSNSNSMDMKQSFGDRPISVIY